jgi:hypothetical protein
VPPSVTNATTAFSFVIPTPADVPSYFLRVVDNSSGSISGNVLIVYGGISVDGMRGVDATVTATVDGVPGTAMIFKGGQWVMPVEVAE